MASNPYDWRRYHPQVEITRRGLDALVEDLCAGDSFALLAGRGMGKSVFLRQVHTELRRRTDVRTVLLPAPPAPLTVETCLRTLAQKLGVDVRNPLGTYDLAVIEVKIWGRNDYRGQVESYWSADVTAGAVIMLTDTVVAEWPERYRRKCLDRPGLETKVESSDASPVLAWLSCTSTTADGMTAEVDHFLLRVPRRR